MKKLLLLWMALLMTGLASATVVSFNFDPATNQTAGNTGVTYAGAVIFKVITFGNYLCKYATDKSLHFTSMASFDENLYTEHKKELTDLPNGVHTYYVKCRPINDLNNNSLGVTWLEATFKISNPIGAVISMEDSPLTAGKHEIFLTTTKVPVTTPKLSYSYDGITYTPLVLEGSDKNWKGYLVISSSPVEKVASFKFEATDLEGKTGTEIVLGNNVFIVDTKPPEPLTSFDAIGEYGDVQLEWYIDDEDDDIDSINIYKSESPNVGLNDFYRNIDRDKEYYVDEDVDDGKTYYYRVAPKDEAGNIASLSREIKVTTLRSQASTSSTGLAPGLLGKVDALLTEINLLEDDLQRAKISLTPSSDEETGEFKLIGVTDAFQSSTSELTATRKTVENLKLQDLEESVLDSRLSSQQVKLNIIKQNIPDTINVLDSAQRTIQITEEDYRLALLELAPDLRSSLIDKSVKESKRLAEEHGLTIQSQIKTFEIIFLDGKKQTKTLIKHAADSTLEAKTNAFLVLRLPESSVTVDDIEMKNLDYTEEQADIISFSTDTKKVTYLVNKQLDTKIIDSITLVPIVVLEDSPGLTGYFLSGFPSLGSSGITLLIIIVAGLLVYLFYMKRIQKETSVSDFLSKAKEVKSLQKEGKVQEATSLYASLQQDYSNLSDQQKQKVFKKIKHLHSKKQ